MWPARFRARDLLLQSLACAVAAMVAGCHVASVLIARAIHCFSFLHAQSVAMVFFQLA